jgi:hypothetical protein
MSSHLFSLFLRLSIDSLEHSMELSAADQLMNTLKCDIKEALPVCGLVSTENILYPEYGEVLFRNLSSRRFFFWSDVNCFMFPVYIATLTETAQ